MFGLFSKKGNNECPINTETRLWMENAFLWLAGQFGQKNIATKQMLYPTTEQFPIRYDGSKNSLFKTAEIIADQMEINFSEIYIDIYEQNIQEFSGDFGHRIWTQVDKDNDESLSAGLYFDKNKDGNYEIFIEKKNLFDPEKLVAVIAHEFSHIKILGEKRLDFNDESLTDLTTVIFGLGIFNANAAFKEHKSFDSHGHSSTGYLKQREWGYALALYAFYRKEENYKWINFLTPNIKSDFKKSINFISANEDIVFHEKYKGGS
jgi:hypothetical protein